MMLDRFDCYELCVQSPRHVAAFLHALHPGAAVLREDFCGTAAVSRRWIEDGRLAGIRRRALAIDLDPAAIDKARSLAAAAAVGGDIEFRLADVLADRDPASADLIFVGNFSIGYIHERAGLVRYLAACADRLRRGHPGLGRGWLVCDTYGGASAFVLGGLERRLPSRGPEFIRYQWSHDAADPLTGMIENSISFRVELNGEIVQELPRAFTYRWRLWSIPELRDAMADAGFATSAAFKDLTLAPGSTPVPVSDPSELGPDWIVLIAGQV